MLYLQQEVRMPVIISDDILKEANMTERDATIEFACHLYDAQKIGKGLAARMAGLTRVEFEDELVKRGMPIIRYTEEMLQEDLKSLERFEELQQRERGGDAGGE